MQILIVEDEKKIANFLRRGLLEESYSVDVANDGEEALYKISINEYDLILLDILLPKINGLEVCKKIREDNLKTPIILLTAKDSQMDKIIGLDAGADDYLTKPFSFGELAARIRAIFRRGNKSNPPILLFDQLTLNPATRVATRNGTEIRLTTKEYALLEYFMRNPNRLLTKTELLEHVWDYNYDGLSNIVETYIKYLRKKLHTSPKVKELIHTLRGSGYILKNV
jgi:DNA-binding response OmpR family regulator